MANFNINLDLEAKKLGKDLENLGENIKNNLKSAIQQLSLNTYAEADRIAAQNLHTSRETYRNALKYEKLSDNTYIIYLQPGSPANYYESGFSGFDMKPGMLNGPKARTTKKGTKYNIIPLQSQPYSKEPTRKKVVSDIREAIRKTVEDKNVKKSIKKFNKESGSYTVTSYKEVADPKIKGLTKVTTQIGKQKRSQYLLFRVVSSNSPANSWQHPGFEGLHAFKKLETYVQTNIDRILRALL